jgi:hypothetical protein
MTTLPIRRIVLYKHGVGHFEREGTVEGEATLALTFRQGEVSDVLKSLTVLDLNGGHVSSVSYDSTKPLEQLLAEVALSIPDRESLVSLLPQLKGARVALHTGVADAVEGCVLGIDTTERQTGDGVVRVVLLSVLTDRGSVRQFDLHNLASLQILDEALRRDLDFYLRTQLSAKKKDARTFTFFAQGTGQRTIRLSYTLEAPVWKATYRLLLGTADDKALIQGWAVVDNTQDEDWENVQLSLISGLPVSFVHDLYTPRYIRRPEVRVKDTTGVLPPEMEEAMPLALMSALAAPAAEAAAVYKSAMLAPPPPAMAPAPGGVGSARGARAMARQAVSSTPVQVREQVIGDMLEYQIEHPVTIRRNQSALVPIVLRPFAGKPVLLYNKRNRAGNPMSAVLFKNTTGLTLEGGPVTVLQGDSYVGEAMLETIKPDEERLVPYAVELSVTATDSLDSHRDTISRVAIRDGLLTTYQAEVHTTTYTFNNKSDRDYVLYLEHPRIPSGATQPQQEWELVEPPGLAEATENYWRFKVTLAPKRPTAVTIKQRCLLEFGYNVTTLALDILEQWLRQRYFDNRTQQVLREVMQKRAEEARLTEQINRLSIEKTDIGTAQQRIRENLQALGDRSAEKDLRERFVRTLNGQEDRLEAIEKELKESNEARNRCREQVSALLGKLDYDAPVSA